MNSSITNAEHFNASPVQGSDAGGGQGEGAPVIEARELFLQYCAKKPLTEQAGQAVQAAPAEAAEAQDRNSAATTPLDALLARVGRFDARLFRESLAAQRREIGSAFRSLTAGDLGWGGIHAYRTGAAFHLVQSAAGVAARLRAKLAEAGIPMLRDEATMATALAELGNFGQGSADHLCGAVVEQPQALPPRKQAAFYRLLDNAVSLLPTALWPSYEPFLRSELLAELKRRNGHASERIAPAHPSLTARFASKLRQLLAAADKK